MQYRDPIAKPPATDRGQKELVQLIGVTLAGRMLTVIMGQVPHRHASYDVFSARPASRKERHYYRQQKGGFPG